VSDHNRCGPKALPAFPRAAAGPIFRRFPTPPIRAGPQWNRESRRPALRPALSLALLLGLLAACAPPATSAQIGVLGGYSRDSFEGYVGDGFRLADRTNGFHTGIFLTFDIGRLGIRPGVAYHQLGGAVIPDDEEAVPIDIEIIELPLDFRLSVPFPVITPYVVGGPTLMFPSSARPAIDVLLARTAWRVDLGVGFEWNIGFRIWPEIRYGRSLGGIIGFDPAGDSNFDTLTARVAISF